MDFAAFSTLCRDLSHTNVDDFPDSRILTYANRVKDDLWSYLITWTQEDYNWDIWKTTSETNQSEYLLPEAATDSEWNLKINWVSINYNWETYDDGSFQYIRATEVRLNNLPYEWNYYRNNQSPDMPIYYVADKSIFIAPQPKTDEARTNWIQLKGIKNIVDYTTSSTESDFGIPSFLLDVLIQWVLPYIHRWEGRKDEASFEEKKYISDRGLAIIKASNRTQAPFYAKYPWGVESNDLINLT